MKKERRGIQSVEVGGQLLVALAEEGAPMLLKDLAQKAGMTSAKAHPYLVSFGNIGLIQQDPVSGRYELGPFALHMGLISLQMLDPVKIAIAEVTSLRDRIDHTVGLAVLGSRGPTFVHLSESHQPVHVRMRTGTVMSIVSTATGRVFSAYLPAKLVEKLSAAEVTDDLMGGAPARKITKKALEALLNEVRRHGMARAVNEPIAGINAISAPVFDHAGQIVLAITVIGPMGTLDPGWNSAAAKELKESAARVSQRLGYRVSA